MQKPRDRESPASLNLGRALWKFRWRLVFLALVLTLLFKSFFPAAKEPVWQGHPLSHWVNSSQYGPALQALGTNALPFLFQELQAKNSALSRLGESVFRRFIDLNWDGAGVRRYYAAIGLQYLDTNAAPALLDAVLSGPMLDAEGDLVRESAFELNRLYTPASQRIILARLTDALRSPDPVWRRNACMVFWFGTKPTSEHMDQISKLTRDADDTVRAAAMRALARWHNDDAVAIPALLAALKDNHPAVRLLAGMAIGSRGTNAASLVPDLQAAYTHEPSLPRPMNDVDILFKGSNALSVQNLRSWFAQDIKQIDPIAKPPQ
jgi:hypothetical protein